MKPVMAALISCAVVAIFTSSTQGSELLYFPFHHIAGNILLGPQLNGTAVGSPVLVPGIRGQALSLDGVSQYVDFGDFRQVAFLVTFVQTFEHTWNISMRRFETSVMVICHFKSHLTSVKKRTTCTGNGNSTV